MTPSEYDIILLAVAILTSTVTTVMYVSKLPKRSEVEKMIQVAVQPIYTELKYINIPHGIRQDNSSQH